MRVISGTARGIRLVAPKGYDVRPTLDRVRESLFNILAPRIEGARFLDLFAGTGANGIEALSRSADRATFVENDPRSIAAIEANLSATRLSASAEIRRLALPQGLSTLWQEGRKFDIVFADPPYAKGHYEDLLRAISDSRLVDGDGIVVVEHSSRLELAEECGGFSRFRSTRYGEIALSFFS